MRGPQHFAPAEKDEREGASRISRALQHPGQRRCDRRHAVLSSAGGQSRDQVSARTAQGDGRVRSGAQRGHERTGSAQAGLLQGVLQRLGHGRSFHDDGVRAPAHGVAPAQRIGQTHRADHSRRSAHLRHGFDNNSSIPFFQKITVYQMANKQYASYTLVNPVITAWNHDSLDYSSSVPAEQTMTLAYEAVAYDTGYVSQGNPPGFAQDHYDTLPSPLKLAGGTHNNLFGPAGVLAGAEAVFGSVSNMLADPSNISINDILRTGTQAINTYNSAKNLNIAGVKNELSTASYNAAVLGVRSVANQPISGLTNFSFPVNTSGNTNTVATPRNLGP